MRYYLLALLFAIILIYINGCSAAYAPKKQHALHTKEQLKIITTEADANTTALPLLSHYNQPSIIPFEQNITNYSAPEGAQRSSKTVQAQFWFYHFRPWLEKRVWVDKDEAMWPFRSYHGNKELFGANLRRVSKEWFEQMQAQSRFDAYGELNATAIILRQSDLRNFPTSLPLFKDPMQAGEGYPFDYLQNSGISAMQPVLVSHFSKNGLWAYVLSGFATGWVKRCDIAYIPTAHANIWMRAKQAHVVSENVPILSSKRDINHQVVTLFQSRIGQILPLIDKNATHTTLLAVSSNAKGEAIYEHVVLANHFITTDNTFTTQQIQHIASELLAQLYGWGDRYGLRDCSSTTRDFFSIFNMWLPRNSSQQANVGSIIDLSELDDEQKRSHIKERGKPFKTLLYRPGHILLYLGVNNGKIMVLHNMWGVRRVKGSDANRAIVGQCVVSSMDVGNTLPYVDANSSLIKSVERMNILPF